MAKNSCDLSAGFATPRLMQSWLQRLSLALTVVVGGNAATMASKSERLPSPAGQNSSRPGAAAGEQAAVARVRVKPRVALAAAGMVVRRQKSTEAAWKSTTGAYRVAVRQPTAKSKSAPRPQPPQPAVELVHLTTHATYRLRADSAQGGFSAAKLRALSQLLRCHHTGKRHAINERLIQILYSTSRHYNNAKLLIVAGYRAPKIARQKGNPKSPHKRGVACDFQVAGIKNEDVRDYLRSTYPKIGLGYYPRAGFVHVDVGRKTGAYWIDYSAPGERARYGRSDPAEPAAPVQVEERASDPDPAKSAPSPANSGDGTEPAATSAALLPSAPAATAEDSL